MIVTISTSGGFGGFGLARSAEVAVEDLPAPLREETCALLDPERLKGLAEAPRGAADFIVYHVTLVTGPGKHARFDLAEPALPPEMLDLIDTLLARGS